VLNATKSSAVFFLHFLCNFFCLFFWDAWYKKTLSWHYFTIEVVISSFIKALLKPGYMHRGYQSETKNTSTFHLYLLCGGGVAVFGTSPALGSGRCETLGMSCTVAGFSSLSLPSLMMSGSWGGDAGVSFLPSLADGLASKMESASSLMEEAVLMFSDCPSSAARRSFSRRVSRPRLWQYQNTNSSTARSQFTYSKK
jgi:hypothetical protein